MPAKDRAKKEARERVPVLEKGLYKRGSITYFYLTGKLFQPCYSRVKRILRFR